jgi:large subunit ribosomal protein L23
MNYHSIIKYPVITEKNTGLRADENKYVFSVEKTATKIDIKKAIEVLFKVKVISINTQLVKGKQKRVGRSTGFKSDWKKAIIRLEKGHTIDKFGEI